MSGGQTRNHFHLENVFGSRARIKIIKVLVINNELTISQIVNKTGLNYSCVLNHLKFLKEINLIQEKKFGRIKIFRFKEENVKANSLKKFIKIWENPKLHHNS